MNKRKIAPVVNKMTFEDAEKADDLYWADTTVEERLNALFDLRKTWFPVQSGKIKMVVVKRSLYEEEAD